MNKMPTHILIYKCLPAWHNTSLCFLVEIFTFKKVDIFFWKPLSQNRTLQGYRLYQIINSTS